MLRTKGGLNDFKVYVIKSGSNDYEGKRCMWLGHSRFRCGNCKIGYFNVVTDSKHDDECPECKHRVVVRWVG